MLSTSLNLLHHGVRGCYITQFFLLDRPPVCSIQIYRSRSTLDAFFYFSSSPSFLTLFFRSTFIANKLRVLSISSLSVTVMEVSSIQWKVWDPRFSFLCLCVILIYNMEWSCLKITLTFPSSIRSLVEHIDWDSYSVSDYNRIQFFTFPGDSAVVPFQLSVEANVYYIRSNFPSFEPWVSA